jgi:RNA polymerase sigma-70 factor (ECF subfamily)
VTANQSAPEVIEPLLAARERFLAFVRARVSNPELAEDILQDALLKAVRAAPALRDSERLVPWFYRVLQNAIVDVYRKDGAAPQVVDVSFADSVPDDPEQVAALCECFRELLPALKPEYAEVIETLDLRGVAGADEAGRLGISANNLKVRHHRARAALRRSLETTCRVCAEHHCLDCTCRATVQV